ncbi:hypothetical protein [Agromyces sp. M3QZ16-3]|uniref:hypothetical protein n=1 Tax=Agromyces sp. M3QZ16-3 TaxID=3447585 RepID=UPI003F68DB74
MPTPNRALTRGERRRITERTRALMPFASEEKAKAVPASVRHRLSREAFLALTVDERKAHLRERARELAVAELDEKRARREQAEADKRAGLLRMVAAIASAPPAPESPAEPVAAPRESLRRWRVSCADGCGTMLPANGPRPVVAYSPGHRPEPPKRRKPIDY